MVGSEEPREQSDQAIISVSRMRCGADAVDVAESAEPRESSDRAIISVTEDHLGKAELPTTAATERSKS